MRPNELPEPTGTAASRQPSRSAGATVRAARQASGLTLAELGQRCGYSASQISRYERGIQPLTDITLLHRFASALEIPPPGSPRELWRPLLAEYGYATKASCWM
jgi:transcriptional regulator with XRE-family HTH domain